MMRRAILVLGFCHAAIGAESPKTAGSTLDGLASVALAAEEQKQASLDGGSTIGFIPLASPSAARSVAQFAAGFFREEDAKIQPPLPSKVVGLGGLLPQLKAAGATHVIALSHDEGGEADYVRFLALGDFSAATFAAAEKAGWGRRHAEGALELAAYKDGKELGAAATLPALPIVRLAQMARQLAAETDCSVDIIALASPEAARSFDEALREAFAEEGETPAKVELPAKARQLAGQLAELKALGATHVVVTAFQNRRGSDVVLVVAKGFRDAETSAKAQARLGARLAPDGSLTLARWIDGEERGIADAAGAAKNEPASGKRAKFR